MWVCKKCETFNKDTDSFCYICKAHKNAFLSAEPEKPSVIEVARPEVKPEPVRIPPVPVREEPPARSYSVPDYSDVDRIVDEYAEREATGGKKRAGKGCLATLNIMALIVAAVVVSIILI